MTDISLRTIPERKRRRLVSFMRELVKGKPVGFAGAIVVVVLLFVGVFADFLAPYPAERAHIADTLLAPSSKYWLGTDHLGRDLLSRVIFGARVSAIVGFVVAAFSTLVSVIIGMVSGYLGKTFDLIVQRGVDIVMCFPALLLHIAILAMLRPGLWQVILVLSLSWGIIGSRVIRGVTMSVKEHAYIQAALSIGCSRARILTTHILPNIMTSAIILFSVRISAAILTEASLSFLGFGIPPPAVSWGGMLSSDSREYMFMAPWMAIWPGVLLSLVVFGANMFGDAVRDILDPRLKGTAGRFGIKARKTES